MRGITRRQKNKQITIKILTNHVIRDNIKITEKAEGSGSYVRKIYDLIHLRSSVGDRLLDTCRILAPLCQEAFSRENFQSEHLEQNGIRFRRFLRRSKP